MHAVHAHHKVSRSLFGGAAFCLDSYILGLWTSHLSIHTFIDLYNIHLYNMLPSHLFYCPPNHSFSHGLLLFACLFKFTYLFSFRCVCMKWGENVACQHTYESQRKETVELVSPSACLWLPGISIKWPDRDGTWQEPLNHPACGFKFEERPDVGEGADTTCPGSPWEREQWRSLPAGCWMDWI